MARRLYWVIVCVSLWVIYAIRAHNILALPAFVDESLHIMRAQVVFEFTDAVASFLPGKLLVYYYFGLFDPQNPSALWLTRQAIALLAPLSAALCFAIVRRVTRHDGASLLVLWLYGASPLLIFFDRMALSDPFVMLFALAMVWGGLAWASQPTDKNSAITGGLFGFALLAKLTALPLAIVPPLLLWWRGGIQAMNLKRLIPIYLVAGMVLAPSFAYVVYQEVAQLDNKQEVVTQSLFVPEDRSRVEQITFNLETYAEAIGAFYPTGLGLLIAIVILGAWLARREVVLWGGIMGAVAVFIVLASAFPSTRYMVLAFPFGLIGLTVWMVRLWERSNSQQGAMITGVLLLVLMSSGLPMVLDMWQTPEQLSLGGQDSWEYISHTSSGYGIRDVAEDLPSDAVVLSTLGSCHSIRFYAPDLRLHCYYFGFYGNPILWEWDAWVIEASATDQIYYLTERVLPLDDDLLTVDAQSIGMYPRPLDGATIYLYQVPIENVIAVEPAP